MARTLEDQVRLAFAQEPELAQQILGALGTCDPASLSLAPTRIHKHTHTHTHTISFAHATIRKEANVTGSPHQPRHQLIVTYSAPSRGMYKYTRIRHRMRLMSVPAKGFDIHHCMSQFQEMRMV